MDENLKMTIKGFNDPKFEIPTQVPEFKAHVNPESYTQTVNVNFSDLQTPGSSGAASSHSNITPKTLKFDFLLDRTGALGILQAAQSGITQDIQDFKRLTLDYEGEIHKPRYLILLWGTLLFRCQLQNLEVEYKMFSRQGIPMRAVLKATFREFMEEELRVSSEDKRSPDLTHVRTVEEGDTLPLMAYRVYGDSSYYLEVARVNQIVNFRNLEPGREIVFPPVEKT